MEQKKGFEIVDNDTLQVINNLKALRERVAGDKNIVFVSKQEYLDAVDALIKSEESKFEYRAIIATLLDN